MITEIDVFCARVKFVITCECNRTLIIAVDGDGGCDWLVELTDERFDVKDLAGYRS